MDQSAYLILPAHVWRVRHAKAIETSVAKITIAEKWLKWVPPPNIQFLHPRAIPYASRTLNRFTSPAAATKRVP